MKIYKLVNVVIVIALLVSAGFAGMFSVEFAVSALLFAILVRGSVYLIDKAINGAAETKEADRS